MNSKLNRIFLITAFLVGIFSSSLTAQENLIHQITSRDQTSQPQLRKTSNTRLKHTSSITEVPEDLLYDLNSAVYIKDNTIIHIEGNAPLAVKLLDTKSYEFLTKRNELYHQVELITLNLDTREDLNTIFNIGAIRGFDNLRYIYLKCQFPINENEIRRLLQHADPEVTFFYHIYNRS